MGDCGSWVVGAEDGCWFGHVVAQQPGETCAYLLSAIDIKEDVEQQFGLALELPHIDRRDESRKNVNTPEVTSRMLEETASNNQKGKGNMRMLLGQGGKRNKVSPSVIDAAANNNHNVLTAEANVTAAAAADGGRTALQAAAEGGHLEIVERLLAAQADVNAAAGGYGGRTALQAAAQGGHLEIVERLLAAQANVNAAAAASRYGGRTALQAAAEGGHLEVVERLLAA
jgi:ankyrin repeat protein